MKELKDFSHEGMFWPCCPVWVDNPDRDCVVEPKWGWFGRFLFWACRGLQNALGFEGWVLEVWER